MIGIRIREMRRQRGLSQEQLGEKAGFSQSKISKIENENCDSLSDLRLIAAALGVKLKELIDDEEPDAGDEKLNSESTVDDYRDGTVKMSEMKCEWRGRLFF